MSVTQHDYERYAAGMVQHTPGATPQFDSHTALGHLHSTCLDDTGITIRRWRQDDARRVRDLLDTDTDTLWIEQFHALHGPDQDGPDWRRTLVAVDSYNRLLGCASIAVNTLHSSRFPCAIDVHPRFRRRGLGAALLDAIKLARPDDLPLSTKVRTANTAAMGFLTKAGAATYARCLNVVIDPNDPAVMRWASRRHKAGSHSMNLQDKDPESLSKVFERQYMWIHQRWSPVGDLDLLTEVAAAEINAIDANASSGVWHDGEIVAVAFAFPVPNEPVLEIVAETTTEHQPWGTEFLAEAVAATLRVTRRRNCLLRFDGHMSDPHLHPVLSALPWLRRDPLDLVEIP